MIGCTLLSKMTVDTCGNIILFMFWTRIEKKRKNEGKHIT